MRKTSLNFNPATIHQFGTLDGDVHPSQQRDSIPINAKRPQLEKHGDGSTATTAKTAAMANENEDQLADLMSECEQFIDKIEKDKQQRNQVVTLPMDEDSDDDE